MKYKAITLFLILIIPTPFYVSLFQLLNSGGLNWPMIWANELTFWGLVFSIFACSGIVIAYIKEKQQKLFLFISMLLLIIALIPMVFNFVNVGLGQSSKADSATLNPIGFWLSDWWT